MPPGNSFPEALLFFTDNYFLPEILLIFPHRGIQGIPAKMQSL